MCVQGTYIDVNGQAHIPATFRRLGNHRAAIRAAHTYALVPIQPPSALRLGLPSESQGEYD